MEDAGLLHSNACNGEAKVLASVNSAQTDAIMPGSDYNPPPQTSPEQNKRGAPNQVREKLFGGAGPIPILRAINIFSTISTRKRRLRRAKCPLSQELREIRL